MMNAEKYTLRQMAKDLDVSTGLIYKAETILDLRDWRSRTPGKKSYYTKEKKQLFHKVIFLSNCGLRLVDIKPLFELEKRINDFAKYHFPVPEMKGVEIEKAIRNKTIDKKLKIRTIPVFLISGLYCGEEGIEYDRLKFEKDLRNSAKLRELYSEYAEMNKNISRKAHNRFDVIGNKMKEVDEMATVKL